MTSWRTWLRRRFCGLRGHIDTVVTITDTKVSLTCPFCGYESPGWMLTLPPPVPRGKRILRFKKRLVA